jgi:hypothetical protein
VAALMKIASEESRKKENSIKQLDGHVFLIEKQYVSYGKFDLTSMFGSNIANTIEAMEQNEEGSGLVWLQSHAFFTGFNKNECEIQRKDV